MTDFRSKGKGRDRKVYPLMGKTLSGKGKGKLVSYKVYTQALDRIEELEDQRDKILGRRPVYVARQGNLSLKVYRDVSPESPREWDNLGTMLIWNREYNLGDKNPYASKEDFKEATSPESGYFDGKDIAVEIPVAFHDYGGWGAKISETGDDNATGYIYATKQQIEKEYGQVDPQTVSKARKVLEEEIKTYNQYLMGEIYGFVIKDRGEVKDSLWGMYANDEKKLKEEIKYNVPDRYKRLVDGLEATP